MSASQFVVEKATMADVERIHALVTHFADRGEMLHRPVGEIYENLRDFFVARHQGETVACGALHIMWRDLAEVKSLAVAQDRQLHGAGKAIVLACLEEARRLGIPTVFALTYKPAFFEKLGFHIANVGQFPRKVWNECYRCPKFPTCQEIALSIELEGVAGSENGRAPARVPLAASPGQ